MKKREVLLAVGIAILTLFMASQTYAQPYNPPVIGSNWQVTGYFDGCMYQGPAKMIEDFNSDMLSLGGPPSFALAMDLILAPGSPSYCPPWLLNINNNMYVDGVFGEIEPCEFGDVCPLCFGWEEPYCVLMQPLNPNPWCYYGTEFYDIWGEFAPDFRSIEGDRKHAIIEVC